jgi:predicted PP-loop superfamily ATPase
VNICTQCILPETFPGASLDEHGVCVHCRKSNGRERKEKDEKKAYKQRFVDLISKLAHTRDERPYDILMAYSGGKDSTYTMSVLKQQYGLRILALSFDNGFVSERARENIRLVTDALDIDHTFFKPQWRLLKKIFTTSAEKELYSKKSLERASTICTSCIGIVKSLCLKTAWELKIPMIGFGWSPGQAPLQSALMKNNPSFVRMSQQAIVGPLSGVVGSEIAPYFLREEHYGDPVRFPYNVHPMAWEYYNEAMILDTIRNYGWRAPEDTDSNSSNCLLNAFANAVHIERYGFHPYVWEIANMVRDGVMTREDGYQKIYGLQDRNLIDAAKKKLES